MTEFKIKGYYYNQQKMVNVYVDLRTASRNINRANVYLSNQIFHTCDISQSGVGWLCWGLTSQSTIFQSCRDGAIASWVINQYFRGVKCLAQGHNTAAVGLEPQTSRSGVRHSTTEPPRSPSQSGVNLPIRCLPLRPPDEAAKIPIFMNSDFSLFPKAKTCFPITTDACFI